MIRSLLVTSLLTHVTLSVRELSKGGPSLRPLSLSQQMLFLLGQDFAPLCFEALISCCPSLKFGNLLEPLVPARLVFLRWLPWLASHRNVNGIGCDFDE